MTARFQPELCPGCRSSPPVGRARTEWQPLKSGRNRPAAGRTARAAWRRRDWKDILWRVYSEFSNDRITLIAAGATFYLLLALFPALAAFVSIYGFVADPTTIADHIAFLGGVLPSGSVDLIRAQLESLAEQNQAALSFGFVFGLLIALWSANNGIKTLFEALNIAYEEREKRSFLWLNLVVARLHPRRHRDRHPLHRRRRRRAGGCSPSSVSRRGGALDRAASLAGPDRRLGRRDLAPLSLRPEPRAREVAVGDLGQHARGGLDGSRPRSSSPGTSPTSPTTMRPTDRSARSSAS